MIAVSDALECSSDFQRNKTGRKKAVGVAKGIETETETQTQSMKRLPWVSGPVSLSSSSSLVCASRWTEDQGQTTKIRDRGNKKWQTWPWVGSLSMYIHIYICVSLPFPLSGPYANTDAAATVWSPFPSRPERLPFFSFTTVELE